MSTAYIRAEPSTDNILGNRQPTHLPTSPIRQIFLAPFIERGVRVRVHVRVRVRVHVRVRVRVHVRVSVRVHVRVHVRVRVRVHVRVHTDCIHPSGAAHRQHTRQPTTHSFTHEPY
jgi:hypothetical protein